MEAEITSKTCLPSYQTARRHIPEDSNLRIHHLEDIRPRYFKVFYSVQSV